jgi:hypothetical protein
MVDIYTHTHTETETDRHTKKHRDMEEKCG